MSKSLTVAYDQPTDTLSLDLVPRNTNQTSNHISDDLLTVPQALDIQGFQSRLAKGERLVLPLVFSNIANLENTASVPPAIANARDVWQAFKNGGAD
jgi:hypothetical protein